MAMSLNRFTFQDTVTTTGNGQELRIARGEYLVVAISGTALTRTVVFEGKGEVGNYLAIQGENLNSGSSATQTTGTTDELWRFNVSALDSIRFRVSSITGGNLSVVGKLVIL